MCLKSFLRALLAIVLCLVMGSSALAQEPATPVAVPTLVPTESAETTPTLEPADEASPTATPVSGVVDNGDGSYTLTALAGDITDLDLSSMLPAGGITFAQLVSLSAMIVSADGSCSTLNPVFYLNDFGDDAPTQGLLIANGDPGNTLPAAPEQPAI